MNVLVHCPTHIHLLGACPREAVSLDGAQAQFLHIGHDPNETCTHGGGLSATTGIKIETCTHGGGLSATTGMPICCRPPSDFFVGVCIQHDRVDCFFILVPKIRSCPFSYLPHCGLQYENAFKKKKIGACGGPGFF